MARTIEAPGVEINEVDLSLRTVTPVGTKVLLHGFANQGPTNELIQVSTKNELDEVFFGNAGPKNAAERYFYYSAGEILNSPATLYVTRFPYGSAAGTGFNGDYTLLAFPFESSNASVSTRASTVLTNVSGTGALSATVVHVLSTTVDNVAGGTFATASAYAVAQPFVIPITEDQYNMVLAGQVQWNNGGTLATTTTVTMSSVSAIVPISTTTTTLVPSSFDTIGYAGMVVVNKARTTINEKYEGYYLAIADNTTDVNAGTYASVSGIKSLNSAQSLIQLSNSQLGFALSGTAYDGNISEVVETSLNYDFANTAYDDSLIMYLFRIRTSNFASDPTKLYNAPVEHFAGSLKGLRQQADHNGQMASYYLGDIVNNSSNYMGMLVNDYIKNNQDYVTLRNRSFTSAPGDLEPIGNFTRCLTVTDSAKYVGDIPSKIQRALTLAEDVQSLDIDIVCGGGLETIFAYTQGAGGNTTFDDTVDVSSDITSLIDPDTGMSSTFAEAHGTIFNLYNNFCQNTRKDCIHYSDPLRCIFVNGENFKTLDNKSNTFSEDIYTPLRNLYADSNSNYSATYANFVKTYDSNTGKYTWMPFSGWQAAITARMDSRFFPWWAPFGLNNGIIPNIVDIAFKPNQKQQGSLYRVGINPIVFFQGDGFTVWGQKTLQAKPSAFDRINVRRLFVTFERSTMKIMRYFVGEPNTIFTRTRVGNVLKPLFDLAKNNQGCYDYLVVCDERNNTPTVIENNEMKVDIYIKPVRTAEFILVTFYCTRTDQDFNELVS